MEFYKFPIINNIDDVLPHIQDCDSIKVFQRRGYQVVDYPYVEPNTFPALTSTDVSYETAVMRRECRGLIFDHNGEVVSRRFHKMFNLFERNETQPDNIDFTREHDVLEKLDGSCIGPFLDVVTDEVRWANEIHLGQKASQKVIFGTMMGFSEVEEACQKFVTASNFAYEVFAREVIEDGYTPIFEYCSIGNRVVVLYEKPKLVLLAIRHRTTGEYLTRVQVQEWASRHQIPVVKSFGPITGDLSDFVANIRGLDDSEGIICSFADGHMFKAKSEWYSRIHKNKEGLVHEKDVWEMILSDKVDDVLPFVTDVEQRALRATIEELHAGIKGVADVVSAFVDKHRHLDRKLFAATITKELPTVMVPFGFKEYSEPGAALEQVRQYAIRSTTSSSRVDEARKILKVQQWGERFGK